MKRVRVRLTWEETDPAKIPYEDIYENAESYVSRGVLYICREEGRTLAAYSRKGWVRVVQEGEDT